MKELQIEVLDSIMGSGKTTGVIKWMKDNPQNKYLYVSPLLTEVEERIPQECLELEFVSPNTVNHKTKADHLLELLEQGVNVSFTHSLFESLKKDHLRLIDRENYVLIIDEEIDFIDQYQGGEYRKEDILTLEKTGHIKVHEEDLGRVEWTWDQDKFEEKSNYGKLKRMCDLKMLHCAKRDRGMIVLHLPIALVEAASRTIVMTYLFEGSIMHKFMELKGVSVKPFIEIQLLKTEAQVKQEACDKIEIFDTPSTRKIKYLINYRLTSSWYKDQASREDLAKVAKAIRSACSKGDREVTMYTVPKHTVITSRRSMKAPIKVVGYAAELCWLYCGTKATNEYAHKNVLVHAFNRHPIVPVMAYLQDYGVPLLTQMISH